jgi:hypothetical protein
VTTTKSKSGKKAGRAAPRRRAALDHLSDQEILDLRFCDLRLTMRGSMLETCIRRLSRELEERSIRFRPHFWLSDEVFSSDGVPGIAVPFYLAHPRLAKLEKAQMLEVEGGTPEWCMKILRHEMGHAIDSAYRLRRRHQWRKIFGRSTNPYPKYYSAKPHSKNYVLHLEEWYAQSHPLEDFAETFAVWVQPGPSWRKRYKDWPALKKLEYVDELMSEIKRKPPLVSLRKRVYPLSKMRRRLRRHYEAKRRHYGDEHPDIYDLDLRRLFTDAGTAGRRRPKAAAFLRRSRSEIRRQVARWTGQHAYTIDMVLEDMISRCRELDLRTVRPERELRVDATILVTVQMMNFLHSGQQLIAL